MKCQFCGEENMLEVRIEKSSRESVVFDPNAFTYYAVSPYKHLFCKNCGKTDTFSEIRKMSTQEAQSVRMFR